MENKLKILHLEDLESDAELVDRQLKRGNLSFEKMVVDTKDEFIAALDKFSPDVILSDHVLPSFNSLEALKIVKHKGLAIPFILVTAAVSEEFAVTMMQEGATDYVLKDRIQRLPNAVSVAVENSRLAEERKKFIENVIANEALMKEAEQLAHFGSWQFNIKTRRLFFSEEMYRILGYEPGEVVPNRFSFLSKVHMEDINLLEEAIETVFRYNQDIHGLTFRIVNKNNDIKFLRTEVVILHNKNGGVIKINGFCQDITEIKNKEQELITSTENLRELALHLQNIREEERESIAREIHDALGQDLTVLKFDLAWIIKKMNTADATLKKKAQGMIKLLNAAIVMVRKIATQLRPSLLDHLGLTEALIWQSSDFEKRTGIKVNFHADSNLPEPKNYAIAIFRIYQESLTNVARHAKATVVDALLECTDNVLLLTIKDNGKGFDVNNIAHKRTLGLLGMKERAIMLGGMYNIESAPGKGTKITVFVPV